MPSKKAQYDGNLQGPRLKIRTCQVGPWGLNAYALVCGETRKSVLIDPGAEPEALERLLAESDPVAIVLTHSHSDHTGALAEMRKRLKVPVMAHPGHHAARYESGCRPMATPREHR